jgi:hypothetical protein
MQIFNEFNARKPDEINIFKGISKNHLFIAIIGITLVLQVRAVILAPLKFFNALGFGPFLCCP